ncbi:MAG: acyl carrier protein [Planctomycetota bacterium]
MTEVLDGVKEVLRESLELGDRVAAFDHATPLFGSLPEFDSMAVVTVVLGLEERFDIVIDGEELSVEVFETVGTLCGFVEDKLGAA